MATFLIIVSNWLEKNQEKNEHHIGCGLDFGSIVYNSGINQIIGSFQ